MPQSSVELGMAERQAVPSLAYGLVTRRPKEMGEVRASDVRVFSRVMLFGFFTRHSSSSSPVPFRKGGTVQGGDSVTIP